MTDRDTALVAPLREVARLRRRRRLLAVALAVAIAFAGVRLLAAVLDWFGSDLPNANLLALVAAAAVAALGALALRRQRAPADELAFEVDRLAGLEQRFGTAVEVGTPADAAAAGSVAVALRRAGLKDAAALDPARLVPLATRPLVAAAAVLALLCAGLLLVPERLADERADVPGADLAADGTGTDALRATAEEVARLLAADAEARDDPYLAAVARAIEERAAAPGDDPVSLRDELEALLDHAAQAYGTRAPEWLGGASATDRLAGLQERLDRFQEEQARRSASRGEPGSPFAQVDMDDYGVDPSVLMREPSPSLGVGMAEGAIEPGANEAAGQLADGAASDGLRRLDQEDLQLAGNMPSGAAMQSGRGRSHAAGLGSETLEGDDAFTSLAASAGEDVVLTATPEAGGRRIRIEVAPEAGAAVPAGAAGALASEGSRLAAEAMQRQFVPADRRAVTARYFARAPQ